VRNNNSVLSRIPTDRGYAGENQGLVYVLRRLLSEGTFKIDYYNSEGLPQRFSSFDSVFRRVSSSFGILGLHKYLPYRHWFRRELAEYINDKLTDARARQMPFWNSDFIGSMAKEHIRGRKNYACEINAVLTLEAVERLFFRDAPYGKFNLERSKNKNLQKEPALTR
jgi:asparagine synthase (glutamine-hydrolysing)